MKTNAGIVEKPVVSEQDAHCYHCGDRCSEQPILKDGHPFCCKGCVSVYSILSDHDMCAYYQNAESVPGIQPVEGELNLKKFDFLDEPKVQEAYIRFRNEKEVHVLFKIPGMHCHSCVWLIEKIHRFNEGITSSRVDFYHKEDHLVFDPSKTDLKQVVVTLSSIGYEPYLSLSDLDQQQEQDQSYKSRLYKLGIAGFCFGNVMLFSFPEYLGMEGGTDSGISNWFPYLNLLLSLPVFFYSASEFYLPAWKAIKRGIVSVDIPVFLAILATFSRSVVDLLMGWGPGFFDSMTGIVFFMLAGRVYQDRSYRSLSFDRNYRSFLPVSVAVKREDEEKYIPVSELKVGEILVIRNAEIIPADSMVLSGEPHIDYSFVTGETDLHKVKDGDIIYAGGKHYGPAIEVVTKRELSQSYLTGLWNQPHARTDEPAHFGQSFVHRLAIRFTWLVLGIAIATAAYWSFYDLNTSFNAFTAVLIIACPCALLLSSSFTYGNITRILSRNGFYMRDTIIIEKIGEADELVFDKTGTLTSGKKKHVAWKGTEEKEIPALAASLAYHSQHPNSRVVAAFLKGVSRHDINDFEEVPGLGVQGKVNGREVRLGSASWCGAPDASQERAVHISVNGVYKGAYVIDTEFRDSLKEVSHDLASSVSLSVISGDNESEKQRLAELLPKNTPLIFHADPNEKMKYISDLRTHQHKVIMVGDGLNDVSALKESDVGIAVSEEGNQFTPSSDAVMAASAFPKLAGIIRFCKKSRNIIIGSFIVSLIYNSFGLFFAIRGDFSPLFAAVIMPLSTVSIIAYTTLVSAFVSRKVGLK